MPLIKLKFSPGMEELVLQGKKCCTTRDEKKGEIGDVFRVKDRLYRIIQIRVSDLSDISNYYILEGFDYRYEFLKKIEEIYPEICNCENELCNLFILFRFLACFKVSKDRRVNKLIMLARTLIMDITSRKPVKIERSTITVGFIESKLFNRRASNL